MICTFPQNVHKGIILNDTLEVVEAYCEKCKTHAYFRKDGYGRVEPSYGDFFKADTLQPSSNLYYRVHPNRMSIES